MAESPRVEHPHLRQVEAFPVLMSGQEFLCLRDPFGLAEKPVFLNKLQVSLVSLMNGSNSLRDIQADFCRRTGEILPFEMIENLVRQLDEFHYLDSSLFRSFFASLAEDFRMEPVRAARHAGAAYEADPDALKRQIESFFEHPDGPGVSSGVDPARPLRGLVAPHIDFHRGGPTYAHAYRALAEHSGADTFIIFGTCHTPMRQRFAITKKHYDTPLGRADTDQTFVEQLAANLKKDYFLDEFCHRGEHSIELQAVYLRHVVEGEFRIVPILVASFQDIYGSGGRAGDDPDILDMVRALRDTMLQRPGHYCVIAGADLSHVGRQFGDPAGLSELSLSEVERLDMELLGLVEAGDAEGMVRSLAADQDRRRVCGSPPIYMTLRCLDKPRGELLQYRQWKDSQAGSAVTYASLALY